MQNGESNCQLSRKPSEGKLIEAKLLIRLQEVNRITFLEATICIGELFSKPELLKQIIYKKFF